MNTIKNIRYIVASTMYYYNANDVLGSIGYTVNSQGIATALLNPKDPFRKELVNIISDKEIYWSKDSLEDLKEYVTVKRAKLIDELLKHLPRASKVNNNGGSTGTYDLPFGNDFLMFIERTSDKVILLDKETGTTREINFKTRTATDKVVGKRYIDKVGSIKDGDEYLYCRTSKLGKPFNIYVSVGEVEEDIETYEKPTNDEPVKSVCKFNYKPVVTHTGVLLVGLAIGMVI